MQKPPRYPQLVLPFRIKLEYIRYAECIRIGTRISYYVEYLSVYRLNQLTLARFTRLRVHAARDARLRLASVNLFNPRQV